jgi:aerobic carbon-monoxide dehydrogenase medium subunit
MKDFEFHRPASVDEVVALLKARPGAKVLSGGQSLLPVLKLELAEPTDLISLAEVPELASIWIEGNHLIVGARCTHDQVSRSANVGSAIPALAALAAQIGDGQVRNRGTLGGSVAHADPAADYPAALVALDATIVTDRREIAVADFFTDLFATALAADELVTAVKFTIPERAAYMKFAHRASKYAVAGVMVARHKDGTSRVAVTGAAAKVFRATAMEAALDANFSPDALDGLAIAADDLVSDLEASADYRAHLIGVMAKRATAAANA